MVLMVGGIRGKPGTICYFHLIRNCTFCTSIHNVSLMRMSKLKNKIYYKRLQVHTELYVLTDSYIASVYYNKSQQSIIYRGVMSFSCNFHGHEMQR
jgi:hypothetical protein